MDTLTTEVVGGMAAISYIGFCYLKTSVKCLSVYACVSAIETMI